MQTSLTNFDNKAKQPLRKHERESGKNSGASKCSNSIFACKIWNATTLTLHIKTRIAGYCESSTECSDHR